MLNRYLENLANLLGQRFSNILFVTLLASFITACDGAGNKELTDNEDLGISLVAASGSNQFADPGQKFENPIIARAVNPLGEALPGVPIEFYTEADGVSILTASGKTDSTGVVATNVVAPPELNRKFEVKAKLPSGSSNITFKLATFPEQLLIISDGPTYNFETEAVGSTRSYAFVLDNTGDVTATDLLGQTSDLPFHFKGGSYPGTGGTCSNSLAAGASCLFVVSFSPSEIGFSSGNVEINYKDGEISRVTSRSLQGTGANLGRLVLSEDPEYDFGVIAVGGTVTHTFVVENTGTLDASAINPDVLSANFNYTGGSYPGTTGDCGSIVTAGTTCNLDITFNPIAPGLQTDTIRLSYFNGVSSDNSERAMRGIGTTPALLEFSDSPVYDYGTQAVSSVTEHVFTLTNNGNSPATSLAGGTILAPFSFKDGLYPGTGGSCTGTLNNGASCTVVITYAPTTATVHSRQISVTYDNGAGPDTATRTVQGTGANLAYLDISQNPIYDYGVQPVGSSTDFTFTVTNTGTGNATTVADGGGLLAPFAYKGGSYPGTGGSCSTLLNAAASCTLVISFTPGTPGPKFDTIQIDYFDGSQNKNAFRDISGTGVAAAFLEISNAPLYDYGTKATATNTDYTFTVINSGGVAASGISESGLAAPFSFKGGSYPGTGGTCGSGLANGSNCTMVITYSPITNGLHTDQIVLDYSDGATSQQATRNIQGTGTDQAAIEISDGPLFNFGTHALGSVNEKVFTLDNTGGLDATSITGTGLAAPFTFKGGSYPGTGGTCSAALLAGANCTVVVTYSPTATGTQTDTMVIDYNNGASTTTSNRDIQGTGATTATLLISDAPTYDFGTQGLTTQKDHAFNVSNTGGVDATSINGLALANPFNYKGGTFPGTGGTCTPTLVPTANCTLVVTFTPTVAGVHNETLQISYNDGALAQTATRDMTGTGANPAFLVISDGPSYDFGTQAINSLTDHTFSINNTGGLSATSITDTLALSAPFRFKGGSYPGTGGTCGAALAPLLSCAIVVTYNPTATGSHSDTLDLQYFDGVATTNVTRDVQGNADASAVLTISGGPTFNFGTKAINSTTDQSFTITNSGAVTATAMSGVALTAPFTYKGGSYPGTGGTCGSSLGGSLTCTVIINFSPLTTGVKASTFQIDYNDGTGATNASIALQGTAASEALLTVSDGPTYDYGTRALGSNTDHAFTINNTGGVAATSVDGVLLTAPYDFKDGSYPGTGGTCGSTLANGANCTVIVTYSPTTIATHNQTLKIDYNNGVSVQQTTRDMTGVGANAAYLSISDGAIFDYGSKALTSNTDHTFTVTNTGGLTATSLLDGGGLAAPFSFKGGTYPGTGGTCGAGLVSLGTCTMIVTYSPTVAGSHSDTILIDYNDGTSAQQAARDIQGTGANPAVITISDGATFDYGSVAVNGNLDHTFTLTHSGGVPAASLIVSGLAAPYSFKGGTYPGTGGDCGASLSVAATCTIVVAFNPTLTGTFNDTILVDYNNGAVPAQVTRPITGLGVTPAILGISNGPTYDFGTKPIGSDTDFTFTVNNTGGSEATSVVGSGLLSPFDFKDGSYPGTGGTCGAAIASSTNCTIVVTYSPTTATTANDTIELNYNNGASAQTATRAVTGTGQNAALLQISETDPFDYGPNALGSTNDHTFNVTNSGGIAATGIADGGGLAAPFSFKGGTFPGTGGTCATGLAASASCAIVVTYSPTVAGSQSDTIVINYNNGLSTVQANRDVQGTGANPAVLTISDGPTYDFGIKGIGSTSEYTLTLSNTGGVAATSLVDGGGLSMPFAFKGGTYPGSGGTCGVSLAPSSNCSIIITFSPTAAVISNDTIEIDYHDGVAPQTSTRDVTGTGSNLAFLTISHGPTFDFGTKTSGSTTDHTFTITNTGGVQATGMVGSGLLAPFTFKGGTYPGASGTCGTALNAANSCTIIVNYSPTAAGVHNDTLNIDYNDGSVPQQVSRDITGTGTDPALLSISDGATYDFGAIAVNSTVEHSFNVNNIGGSPATSLVGTGLAAPFSFKGGTYPGTGGTCGPSINNGALCTIVVTYNPTVTGSHSDTIQLDYNDGSGSTANATRGVQGTSTTPALISISETNPYDFGSRALGSTTEHSFTLGNTGGVQATTMAGAGLVPPFSFKDGAYPGTGGTCGLTLNSSSNCTIIVTYTPSTTALHQDTIVINYNDGTTGQSSSRDVEGTGASSAFLEISDAATYDYNEVPVGGNAEHVFTVSNTGAVTATAIADGLGLASPFAFKGGSFPGTGGNCGTSLNASGSCNIVVTYSPIASGLHTDTIVVSYNNGASLTNAQRDIQGTGVDVADLAISNGPTYNFGQQPTGSSTDATLTITNNGGYAASGIAGSGLAAPFNFKGGSYPGTGGTCGATLAAAASCTIVIRFQPVALTVSNDAVVIDYNDGVSAQQVSRDITGEGINGAALVISDATTFNFGTKAIGSVTEHSFTVDNTGGAAATGMSGAVLSAPFAFKGGSYPGTGGNCAGSLNASNQCTVVVTYSPAGAGQHTQTLTINYNNGAGPTTANRDMEGTGANPATLDIAEAPTYDFGSVPVNSLQEATINVTNNGGVPATAIVASGLAAPYTFKGGTYPGTGGDCGIGLAATASCTMVIEFNPTITGTLTDTLNLNFNDGTGPDLSSLDFTSTVTNPAILTINESPEYNFGTHPIGSVNEYTLNVQNTGASNATSVSGGGLAAPFAFKDGSYPGTGGTCTGTINAAATCTIIITYSPSAAITSTDAIEINYNNGSTGTSATRNVKGTGASAAVLNISEVDPYDYGNKAVGSGTDYTFTLTNNGDISATNIVDAGGLAAPFNWKGGSFPGTGGTCSGGGSLAAAASCTVVVRFSPVATGTFPDTIVINYNDGLAIVPTTRAIQGTGVAPAVLDISDGITYSFGTKGVGSVTEHTFNVTNNGGADASTVADGLGLAAPFNWKGGTYPGSGGTCGSVLAASASCTIIVTFAPIGAAPYNDSIEIDYHDGAAAQTSVRPVTGTGANLAFLTITPATTFDYGIKAIGSLTDQTFTLENTGGVDATAMDGVGLVAPFSFKGGTYPGTGGNCSTSLTASTTCTIVVTYNPSAAVFSADQIDINYHDGSAAQTVSRDIQGTGANPATLVISDAAAYDFGTAPTGGSKDHTFTVDNTGGVPATAIADAGALAAPFSFKGGSYPGTDGTCGISLANGAQCTIVVTFAPTVTGPQGDTIQLNYNSGVSGTSSTRDILGLGANPANILITEAPTYDFGSVPVASNLDVTVNLTNNGGVNATGIAGSGLAAPYTFKGGSYPGTGGTCNTSLAPSTACTIVVNFNPLSTGTLTDTLNVNYNDGVVSQQKTLGFTAVVTSAAALSISHGPSHDFGTRPLSSVNEVTMTVTNAGDTDATAVTGGGLAAPFEYKGGSYPGTGGTCGIAIPSGTCTIIVTFTPTAGVTYQDFIEIDYNNGTTMQQAVRQVDGQGAAAAILNISETDPYDYGVHALNSNTDHTFMITNNGGLAASAIADGLGLAAPFAWKGGTFPGTAGTCGTGLAIGASCSIVVTYTPTLAGAHSDTIVIDYNDGLVAKQSTRDIQGNGVGAALLNISETNPYNFGSVAVNASVDHVFVVTNNGGAEATGITDNSSLAAPFSFKGGTYPGSGGDCGASLAAASSCNIIVTFLPTSTGAQSDTIVLDYNDGSSAQQTTRDIQGSGSNLGVLTITDTPTLDFGTQAVGSISEHTFTVENTGGVAVSAMSGTGLALPFNFKGGSYPGTGGDCGTSLNPGVTCDIVVTYNPSGAAIHNDTLIVNYYDGVAAQATSVGVTGTGATPALLVISEAPYYDYLTVASGGKKDKTFIVDNTGGFPASSLTDGGGLALPFKFKDGTYPGTGGTCGGSLNNGNQCTIVVTYNPSATGSHSDTIVLSYNDGAAAQVANRNIQGTATAAAVIDISEVDPYDFGLKAIGSTTEYTFTLTNNGGVQATAMTGTGLAAPFAFKDGTYPGTGGNCGLTLNDGVSCDIVVTFTPSAATAYNDTIDINYNDGAGPQISSRIIQGQGASVAVLDISEADPFDYGDVPNGGFKDHSFTITNNGPLTATGITGGGLAAPWSFKDGTYPGTGGNCGTSLNSAGTCTVVVTYSPTSTGPSADTIDIAYNNGAIGTNSTRDVQGNGVNAGFLTITNAPLYDFGQKAQLSVNEATLTLENTGGFETTDMAGSGLADQFSFKAGAYPGTGGTCSNTLAVSTTCTIVITYTPDTIALHSDTIIIDYNDGIVAKQVTRNVQGEGISGANIVISHGATYNFGSKAVNSVTEHTFIVSNAGSTSATSLNGAALTAPFRYKGGSFPGNGGDCSATLGNSASCLVVVEFVPTTQTTETDTLTINYFNGAAAAASNRAMEGTGAPPANLTIAEAPTYAIGAKTVNSSTEFTVNVTNDGGVPATFMDGTGLAAPYTFKGGPYPGTGGTCGASLAVSGSCTMIVIYNPTTTGPHNDNLNLDYYNGASNQQSQLALTAVSNAPAILTLSHGTTYNFGNIAIGASSEWTFTVTNIGASQATGMDGVGLLLPFEFKDSAYPGTGGDCGATLDPSNACSIVVTFIPGAPGIYNDNIEIDYIDGVNPQTAVRAITGEGSSAGVIEISEDPLYNYGVVATTSINDYTLTLTNTGDLPVSGMAGSGLAAPFSFKDGTYPGTNGDCGASLGAGASCDIVVTYNPLTVGTHSDTIVIDYDDTVTTKQATRNIQGNGANPASLAISESDPYDYGATGPGIPLQHIFTITNSGGVASKSMAFSGLAAPFSFSGGSFPGTNGDCAAILAAGSSCDVEVEFNPPSPGNYVDTLNLAYNDGTPVGKNTSRNIEGDGANLALLAISASPFYDYGQEAVGARIDYTFSVINNGELTATGITGAGLLAPFSYRGGSYPGVGGDCDSDLAPAETCNIVVRFSPNALGVVSDEIELIYHNGSAVVNSLRQVNGEGVNPANLTIAPASMNSFSWGVRAVGSAAVMTYIITNDGDVNATNITEYSLNNEFDYVGGVYPGTGGTCSTSLTAAATCTLKVVFTPTSTGFQSSQIIIDYENGTHDATPAPLTDTLTRNINGDANPPAVLEATPSSHDFGLVVAGNTEEIFINIENTGGVQSTAMTGAGLTPPYYYKGGTYPGSGGSCDITLNPGNNCDIVVIYQPVTAGTHNGFAQINYNDGTGAKNIQIPVTAQAVDSAVLQISGSNPYDFGVRGTNTTTTAQLTVTNVGGADASSIASAAMTPPFAWTGGSFPGTGGNCSSDLLLGASCIIEVEYAPTTQGTHGQAFTINFYDGSVNDSLTHNLGGQASDTAYLEISDSPSYNYGGRVINTSTDYEFTITNNGGQVASTMAGTGLAVPFSFKGGTFPGIGGSCTTDLAVSASCTIQVTFNPTGAGSFNDTIQINYNDGVQAQSVGRQVFGQAASAGVLSFQGGAIYNFGARATGGTTHRTITVENTGGTVITNIQDGFELAAPFEFRGGTYPGTGGDCSTSLGSAATCDIVVTYAPTANGADSDTLELDYHDGAQAQTASLIVQGTSNDPALLEFNDGATYNFGNTSTGATKTKTLTLTNNGGVLIRDTSINPLGNPGGYFQYVGNNFPGTGGTCGTANIPVGGTCTIVVSYSPLTLGAHSTTVSFSYDDGAQTQIATIDLDGAGQNAAILTISHGPTYDYGNVALTGVKNFTFTVTNTGDIQATSMGDGAGLVPPYSFKGGSYPGDGGTCGTTLNGSNSTCTIVVSFSPVSSGAHSDTVLIDYHNGVTAQTTSRAVTGNGLSNAVLNITNVTTNDYGTVAPNTSHDLTFNINNSGGVSATSIADGLGLTAPFSWKGGTFPGTGGNCNVSLAPVSNCTLVVTYNPTANGSHSDSIVVDYFDGSSSQSASHLIQGIADDPASLSISDNAYSFGSVAVNSSQNKVFTITNNGGVTATSLAVNGIAAPYGFTGGSYPGTAGNCGTQLTASNSCTIDLTFSPTTGGVKPETIQVDYFDGNSAQQVNNSISGTSVLVAILDISDGPTYNYGPVTVNTTAEWTFTVTNNGGVTATSINDGLGLSSPYTWKGGSYPGSGGDCPINGSLGVAASCTIVINYTPTNTSTHPDQVVIDYNDSLSAQQATRNITGTGSSLAVITISDGATYNYGTVAANTSHDKVFTLTNSGSAEATSLGDGLGLAAPFSWKGGSFPGTSGTCANGGNLSGSGGTCTVVVTYNPTANGSHGDTLLVSYNNGNSVLNASRPMQGVADNPAVLDISEAATYNYGNVVTSTTKDHTFVLTNNGGVTVSMASLADDLGLAAPFNWKGGSFPGAGGNCGTANVAPLANCTIVVTFSPTTPGLKSDTISVSYNNGVSTVTTQRDVIGTGISLAVLSISESEPYNYGAVATNSGNDYEFTVTNTGTGTATSMADGLQLSGFFNWKGGTYPGAGGTCNTDLAGSSSCTIYVTYAPTVAGAHSSQIKIDYYDSQANQSVTRGVQGTSSAPANLTISHGATYNYGNVPVSTIVEHTFTLTNSGEITATQMGDDFQLAIPYAFKNGTYPGTGGSCALTLAPLGTCTIVVTFYPQIASTVNDTIVVNYHSGLIPTTAERAVTGTGVNPAVLTISDGATYNYGTQALSTSTDHTFVVTNSGGNNATSLSGSGLAAPYGWKDGSYPGTGGTCDADLTTGEGTCTIVVTYTPISAGTHNDQIIMTYNDGSAIQQALRNVTGMGGATNTTEYCSSRQGNSPFAGGTGSGGDPYTICTPTQLLNISSYLSSNFEQRDHLDFSSTSFTPIGTSGSPFTGTYNGKNYKIDSVSFNNSGTSYVGLFGASSGALSNINMVGLSLTGQNFVGGIVGSMTGGSISYSQVTGSSINGTDNLGGVVGSASSGTITKTWAKINVNGGAGSDNVGGFVGSSAATITESYVGASTINGVNKVGGFAGLTSGGSITDAYANSSVSGTDAIGGFVGDKSGALTRVHSTGSVSGSTNVGGLIGSKTAGSETDSYWNSTTSAQGSSSGAETALTSANMALLSSFTNWNFNGIWKLDGGSPTLSYISYNALTNPASYYLSETFEGVGTLESWDGSSVTSGNTYNVDDTSFISTYTPGIWGSQSLRVSTNSGSADDISFDTLTFGASKNHTWTSFDVAFTTLPAPVTSTLSLIEVTDAGNTSTAYSVDIVNDGGNNRLMFNVYHDGSLNQYLWPSTGAIQTGQIYRVNLKWDINNEVWEILVNGKTFQSGTLSNSAASLAIGLMATGSAIGNAAMDADYDLDNLRVSQATTQAIANGSETIVTLSTSGTPTSCSIKNLTRAAVSSPCSCISGTCSVGLTGTSTGTGRFDYTYTTSGSTSPPAAVEISVP